MNELSLPTDNTVNSKIVWRPLFSNLRCIQVPLTEVPSVIDLYTFDTVLSGGGSLSEDRFLLFLNVMLCEGNIKSITLIDKDTKYLSNSTLAYVEYLKCSARKKAISNAKVIRKEIASRSTNTTLSILATKFMNNAKISNVTASTPANQVQLISSRFTPNLEAIQNALKYDKKLYYPSALEFEKAIQNALKYDKKLYYPSALEFEKVSSLMDTYEAEGIAISKQYGIKNAQDPKEQAVLLGITSTIMLTLLTKSNSAKNDIQLNPKWLTLDKWDPYLVAAKKYFPNTQAILCDWHEDQEKFDERKVTILDAEKLQAAVGIMKLDTARVITSYFRTHWFDTWLDYKHDNCPMKTNMLLESYFKKDMLIYYQGRYTKSLHANLEKIRTSIRVDAGEIERFWQGEGKPLTKSKLQRKKEKIIKQGESLYKKNQIDQNSWNVFRFDINNDVQHAAAKLNDDDHTAAELDDDDVQYAAAELDDDDDVQNAVAELDDYDVSKKSSRLSESREIKIPESNDDYFIKQHGKVLCVTRKNRKFACPCSFNVIRGHDCQDIAAVRFFINKFEAQNNHKAQR
ncbi:hypothetical protein C2G38_2173562 [Gigaspora rosea]|uniref:SWIM-type domain-containing protein n=1 Tax=Gigaspora rosea TaxID=44941 RepID=A0A397VNR9_9GLOM|nr:hypothetical protein C2G38_2173562 [Gigaspora rosea]